MFYPALCLPTVGHYLKHLSGHADLLIGAFSQYQNISSLWNVGTSVGALISAGSMSGARTAATSQLATHASKNESWKRWQFLAARTGTYGAIIAGGVAAYVNRKEIAESLSKVNKQNISESWSKVNTQNIYSGLAQVPAYVSRDSIGEGFTWMASHLKFVGALMKPAQLKMRLERLGQLKGIGVANFYASLGENGYWTGGYFVPKRTFCAVPKKGENGEELFREQPNADASDEIAAHCSMFRPQKNPKYAEMKEKAGDLVLEWLKNDPRSVVDEYTPSHSQRERSMSEAQLWDDDGNVLSQKQEKDKEEGDEEQLERILKADGMPEEVDGGVTDEDLEKAKELPLPEEDVSEEDMKKLWDGDGEKDASKTWRSRLAPFTRISMPSMPNMPNLPQMQVPSMPSIPSFRKSSQKKEDGTDEDLKRKADDAFPAEDEKAPALPPRPEDDTAEGNVTEEGREILNEAEVPALSPRTEEKQQDKNLTDEGFENGSGDEVKREVAEQLQEIHRDLPADVAEKRADEVLKGWGVPIQGEDVVDRDQIAVPEEQNVPSKEVIKEKAPVDT
jgi:hypothetical protein